MNQPEEGEKNLEQAYRYYKAYMHEPKFKLLDFTTCIIDVYSISSMFNGKETLKEQLKWTDRCDSLLTWYSQQEQFGDHRLLNMLRQIQYSSARQVVETMAEAVTQHRNGADPNDDLTMMCIHYFSS